MKHWIFHLAQLIAFSSEITQIIHELFRPHLIVEMAPAVHDSLKYRLEMAPVHDSLKYRQKMAPVHDSLKYRLKMAPVVHDSLKYRLETAPASMTLFLDHGRSL